MKLYEITSQYLQLLELAEDPDMDPEILTDTMEAIQGDFEEKADGYAKVISNITAEAEAVKKEIDRLQARKKALEGSAKRIKENLQRAMIETDHKKFKTTLFSFSVQKNAPSVVIDADDIWKLPAEFIIIPDPVADKTALKEALKSGKEYPGIAHLEQSESLRIR